MNARYPVSPLRLYSLGLRLSFVADSYLGRNNIGYRLWHCLGSVTPVTPLCDRLSRNATPVPPVKGLLLPALNQGFILRY
jgi:hypothetical protein